MWYWQSCTWIELVSMTETGEKSSEWNSGLEPTNTGPTVTHVRQELLSSFCFPCEKTDYVWQAHTCQLTRVVWFGLVFFFVAGCSGTGRGRSSFPPSLPWHPAVDQDEVGGSDSASLWWTLSLYVGVDSSTHTQCLAPSGMLLSNLHLRPITML